MHPLPAIGSIAAGSFLPGPARTSSGRIFPQKKSKRRNNVKQFRRPACRIGSVERNRKEIIPWDTMTKDGTEIYYKVGGTTTGRLQSWLPLSADAFEDKMFYLTARGPLHCS